MGRSKLPIAGLVILGVLALFLLQNNSPTLSVTFLGIVSIPLPLGVLLLAPFLAGLISAGMIALILPRRHRPQRQTAYSASRAPQPRGYDTPSNSQSSTGAGEGNWVDEGLEETPGKTKASWEGGKPATANPASDDPLRTVEAEDAPEEVWDEEDWPEEENSAEVPVGNYEVSKKPVSEYREGTLYSYSYSQSALTETSSGDRENPGDLGKIESEEEPQIHEIPEKTPGVEERLDEEEIVLETSVILPVSEAEPEPEETIEAEFLEDSDESENSQKSQRFLGSKLFNLKTKSPNRDDWTEPPRAPKDW